MKATLGLFCLFTFCFVACKGTPSSPTSLEKYFSGKWIGPCYEVTEDLTIREALSIKKGLFKRFVYVFKEDSSTSSNNEFCKLENKLVQLEYYGSDLTIDKVGKSSYEASTKFSLITVSCLC